MKGREKVSGQWSVLLLCLVITLGGCSGKLGSVKPLAAPERSVAEQQLRDFMAQPAPPALDADIRLHWDILGYAGSVDGMLQIQPPAYVRLTLVDPLGRPLFILASDGKEYTAVNSQLGRAYIGDTGSDTWQKYIGQLDPAELFPVLGGRIPPKYQNLASVGVVDGHRWYVFTADEKSFRYQLDKTGKTMVEQIMVTPAGEPGIRVAYNGFKKRSEGSGASFWWPEKLTIEGTVVRGRIDVEFREIVATRLLAPAHFKLSIPSHYHVEVAD